MNAPEPSGRPALRFTFGTVLGFAAGFGDGLMGFLFDGMEGLNRDALNFERFFFTMGHVITELKWNIVIKTIKRTCFFRCRITRGHGF